MIAPPIIDPRAPAIVDRLFAIVDRPWISVVFASSKKNDPPVVEIAFSPALHFVGQASAEEEVGSTAELVEIATVRAAFFSTRSSTMLDMIRLLRRNSVVARFAVFCTLQCVLGCSSSSNSEGSQSTGCPDGSILLYTRGCDQKPTCLDLRYDTCTRPEDVECTCATHQLIHVGACYAGYGADMPIETDLTACAPDAMPDADVGGDIDVGVDIGMDSD